jgi:hypothetical protein
LGRREDSSGAEDGRVGIARLKDRNGPITELKKTIEIDQKGELDPPKISARALLELGVPLPD